MPKKATRKDNKGRVLQKGEGYRTDKGLYYFTYSGPDRKRHTVYSTTLQELREVEKQLFKDTLDGIDTYVAGKATLNYMVDRYFDTKKSIRESTLVNYKYTYNRFVRESFGQRPIGDIKYSDIKLFYIGLIEEQGKDISTVDNIHTILHPAFDMAVRDDIIRKNPSDKVMGEIRKLFGKSKKKRHALTLEQQRAFLNYVKNNPVYQHWYPLFIVMFGTGCRVGEISGLEWTDLDYNKRTIKIDRAIVYRPDLYGKCACHVHDTKSEKGNRIIPMLNHVYEALQVEYLQQKNTHFCEDEIDGESGFIFSNREGQVLLSGPINKAIQRISDAYNSEETIAAAKAGREAVLLPKFSCHVIRHTFCTRMVESGINIKALQEIMGHADIQTTLNIYAEITEDKKLEIMKAIDHDDTVF